MLETLRRMLYIWARLYATEKTHVSKLARYRRASAAQRYGGAHGGAQLKKD